MYYQAYLRHKLDFFNQIIVLQKKHYPNYHNKLLQFQATASVKNELFETI